MITKTHTLSTRRRLSPSLLMRPRFILIRFRNRKYLQNINVLCMVSKRRDLNRISVRLQCFCRTICSNETTNRAENWATLWCLNDHDLDGFPQRCRAQCSHSRILECDSVLQNRIKFRHIRCRHVIIYFWFRKFALSPYREDQNFEDSYCSLMRTIGKFVLLSTSRRLEFRRSASQALICRFA